MDQLIQCKALLPVLIIDFEPGTPYLYQFPFSLFLAFHINRADRGLPHISARILQVTACPSSKDLLDDEQGYFRHMALSPYSIANT